MLSEWSHDVRISRTPVSFTSLRMCEPSGVARLLRAYAEDLAAAANEHRPPPGRKWTTQPHDHFYFEVGRHTLYGLGKKGSASKSVTIREGLQNQLSTPIPEERYESSPPDEEERERGSYPRRVPLGKQLCFHHLKTLLGLKGSDSKLVECRAGSTCERVHPKSLGEVTLEEVVRITGGWNHEERKARDWFKSYKKGSE